MLYDYISKQYDRRLNGNKVFYALESKAFDKFEYSGIAKQLETIMKELFTSILNLDLQEQFQNIPYN